MSQSILVRPKPFKNMLKFLRHNSAKSLRASATDYYNGLFFEPHASTGYTIMATDGRRLGAWHEADAIWPEEGALFPPDKRMVFLPYTGITGRLLTGIYGDEAVISIDLTHKQVSVFPMEKKAADLLKREKISWQQAADETMALEKPPQLSVTSAIEFRNAFNWQNIVPEQVDPGKDGVVPFNPALMATFAAVAEPYHSMTMLQLEERNMLIVTFPMLPQFVGVFMATRGDTTGLLRDDIMSRVCATVGRSAPTAG